MFFAVMCAPDLPVGRTLTPKAETFSALFGDHQQFWMITARFLVCSGLRFTPPSANQVAGANQAADLMMALRRWMAREWSCEMRGSLTPSSAPRSLNFTPRK